MIISILTADTVAEFKTFKTLLLEYQARNKMFHHQIFVVVYLSENQLHNSSLMCVALSTVIKLSICYP